MFSSPSPFIPCLLSHLLEPPLDTSKSLLQFLLELKKRKEKVPLASWETLSYLYEEADIGVRQLTDICTSLQYKQWWTFRSKRYLWGKFLRAKYCQRSNPSPKNIPMANPLFGSIWDKY
ncbi:hypothetical protein H5410_056315 [Solanum commersonii]|uniref:Uncharacterized protein n=1 Tax=Solanum commersonii TaxID=4109 RepID=A0A9J5WLD2_SOLCO|nr:hypothetical protein H5410_056315 [Solanum commersonii]